ncbi:MAG: hypothetical protein A2W25_15480 [candidate division Zixibacteria bacterium RBG_16_53_22]|nr:MAG: hypothetical protein A2W25_15480 [candidate division Zixibacteria bacterium RBG_16_53_22]
MTAIEQAKKLRDLIIESRALMYRAGRTATESEVKFRADTLAAVLLIALNDVNTMITEWEEVDKS